MEDLALALRDYLKEHRMSVPEFAKQAKVHFNTVYRVLNQDSMVKDKTLKKVAECIGKKLDISLQDAA